MSILRESSSFPREHAPGSPRAERGSDRPAVHENSSASNFDMNIRCKTCGLVVQVPAGGRRLCGCGGWLSAEDADEPVAVVEEGEPGAAPLEGDLAAIERLNDGYRRIRKEMAKII